MIEVNLRPGGKKRSSRRKRSRTSSFKLPALPTLNRMTAFIVVAWIAGPLLIGWLFFGARSRSADLAVQLEKAAADSARYAKLIQANDRLRARRDTIAEKLEIIQGVDAGRYIWSHILDEVSRALPQYTWLVALNQTKGGKLPEFRIEGRAGSTFALTRYMTNLESSPFIHGVRMTSTELTSEGNKVVYRFMLEAAYELPPPELVQTTPLFAIGEK